MPRLTKSFIYLITLSLFSTQLSFATNDMQDNFDRYSKTYENNAKDLIQLKKLNNKINPQDYTKEDVNNIKAKEYYKNPDAIENASRQAY